MGYNKNFYPLFRLAMPLSITGLLQSSIFFLETLFFSHLNHNVLAAGALVGWLFGTFTYFLNGTLSSVNILVAHHYGSNNKEEIALITRDGIWLSILLAIPTMIIFWNMTPLFLLFGQDKSIVLLAKPYLHALSWGILPTFALFALLELIIGLGYAHTLLIFSLLYVSLNIFFSFSLIFGEFGLPELGLAGAGWAETVSSIIALTLMIMYFLVNKNYTHYLHYLFKPTQKTYVLELLRIGSPMGVMYSIEVTFFFALTLMMGSFSSLAMASNQIVLQYMETIMQIVFSIAQGATVRIGHLLGSGNKGSAEKTGYLGVFMAAMFMIVVGISYWCFPTTLISIDLNIHNQDNAEIIALTTQLLSIGALFQISESIRIGLFGALRGLKDTQFTLVISFISFWVIALPLGYLLSTYFHLKGAGLWWGMVAGSVLSIPILLYRFKSKIRDY